MISKHKPHAVFSFKEEKYQYSIGTDKLSMKVYKPIEFVNLETGEIISASDASRQRIWTSDKYVGKLQQQQNYWLSKLDARLLEIAGIVLQYRSGSGNMLCQIDDLAEYVSQAQGRRKDRVRTSILKLVGVLFISTDLELRECFKKFGGIELNGVFRKDACMFITSALIRSSGCQEQT